MRKTHTLKKVSFTLFTVSPFGFLPQEGLHYGKTRERGSSRKRKNNNPPPPVIELRAPSDNKENTTPFHGEGDSDPEWNSSCDRASISNLTYPP